MHHALCTIHHTLCTNGYMVCKEELDWGAKPQRKGSLEKMLAAPVHSAFELRAQNLLHHEGDAATMGGDAATDGGAQPGGMVVEEEEEEQEPEVPPQPWQLDQVRIHRESRHHHHKHKGAGSELMEEQPPPPPHHLLPGHPDFHPDIPHTWPIRSHYIHLLSTPYPLTIHSSYTHTWPSAEYACCTRPCGTRCSTSSSLPTHSQRGSITCCTRRNWSVHSPVAVCS
jgi:hypothetical protein